MGKTFCIQKLVPQKPFVWARDDQSSGAWVQEMLKGKSGKEVFCEPGEQRYGSFLIVGDQRHSVGHSSTLCREQQEATSRLGMDGSETLRALPERNFCPLGLSYWPSGRVW